MRRYISGSRCCFWRWTDITFDSKLYMRRLHIVQLQVPVGGKLYGGAVMLHWIRTADPQLDLHDHPVSFLSIPLRGGYLEELHNGKRRWIDGFRYNWKRATDSHRIIAVLPETLMLVLAGPTRRAWGFHTPTGWVAWRDYEDTKDETT
ncbi:MAG: hypothetical protein ACREYE_23575 [Gammaproteobacteria bacterium]